jgi:thiol-disulfide isomerase/thioredoxin
MESVRPGVHLPAEGHLPSLDGATEWLNSSPLTPSDLRGKVAVFDFCTYTCINWIRTLPYVRAWAETYRDHGLVMIGVHTPEFSFERDLGNVHEALRQMRVMYPVAVDSDHAIWEAFANQYWPALYFVDAGGRIRHHRFGEGDYDRSEVVIQQLLAETGAEGIGDRLVSVAPGGAEVAADWDSLGSPEMYLGYGRTSRFASAGGLAPNEARAYAIPDRLRRNHWALSGDWRVTSEAAVLNEPGGRIAYRFDARDVHLVMGPPARGSSVPFRVSIDGAPPGADAGSDVRADGSGELDQQRMYQLIRQHGPITDRLFEIEFLEPGAEGFAFTFG